MDASENTLDPGILDVRKDLITRDQEKYLLAMARRAITSYLVNRKWAIDHPTDLFYQRRAGVFVTLWQYYSASPRDFNEELAFPGRLRGCIGHIESDKPLVEVVPEMAVQAATADHRFPTLTMQEIEEISIEISILSPLERIITLEKIEIGTHGLVLISDGRRGLLLPDVATRYDWNPEEFADNLCRKIGLPVDSWRTGASLFRFETHSFSEGQ